MNKWVSKEETVFNIPRHGEGVCKSRNVSRHTITRQGSFEISPGSNNGCNSYALSI